MLKTKRNKVLQILDWCQNNFGKSKGLQFPKLRLYKSKGTSICRNGSYGCYYYDSNTISIFLGPHRSNPSLCDTILHEYKHYLLGDEKYNKIFNKLKRNGWSEQKILLIHPHEKICDKFAADHDPQCYQEVFKK